LGRSRYGGASAPAESAQKAGRQARKPRLKLGKVINEVAGYPPHCLVRRVRPGRLPAGGNFEWDAVPARPCHSQLKDVVHHAGHHIGGVPVVDRRPSIGHDVDIASGDRQTGALLTHPGAGCRAGRPASGMRVRELNGFAGWACMRRLVPWLSLAVCA
jgi:hypothetical protein